MDHPILQFLLSETHSLVTRKPIPSLILNTFDGLETPILTRLRALLPKIYAVGPLHALLHSLTAGSPNLQPEPVTEPGSDGSLQEQDRRCLRWLDGQPPRSVIYVSFGSLAVLPRDQVLEIWHGLVGSGQRFLWALRQHAFDLPAAEGRERGRGRGCVVGWAPQEEVLAHWAVGGFLTHAGWNSTLEAVVAGVPMIGWPQIVDQHVNSRFLSERWRLGFDMKDTCDRSTVEKLVRDLMENMGDDTAESTVEMARKARSAVAEVGSSRSALAELIEDIRSLQFEGKNYH